jgi:hypothetical protein
MATSGASGGHLRCGALAATGLFPVAVGRLPDFQGAADARDWRREDEARIGNEARLDEEGTMTKLQGGTAVRQGYYFHVQDWALHPVGRDGELLPGAARESYFHVPVLLALLIAPLMGAAFLMFLPFIGFYLVFGAALRRVARFFGRSASEIAATVQPGWKPGEAHLTGKRGEEGPPQPAERKGPDELTELEREVEARRREKH